MIPIQEPNGDYFWQTLENIPKTFIIVVLKNSETQAWQRLGELGINVVDVWTMREEDTSTFHLPTTTEPSLVCV